MSDSSTGERLRPSVSEILERRGHFSPNPELAESAKRFYREAMAARRAKERNDAKLLGRVLLAATLSTGLVLGVYQKKQLHGRLSWPLLSVIGGVHMCFIAGVDYFIGRLVQRHHIDLNLFGFSI